MGGFESRITKLEEHLEAPGCVCGARRARFVILNEIDGPLTPAQVDEARSCFWICPAHGPSQVTYLLHICLSRRSKLSGICHSAFQHL